jgi:hypothetical protein
MKIDGHELQVGDVVEIYSKREATVTRVPNSQTGFDSVDSGPACDDVRFIRAGRPDGIYQSDFGTPYLMQYGKLYECTAGGRVKISNIEDRFIRMKLVRLVPES